MSKHTPGPWKVTRVRSGCRMIGGDKRGVGRQAQYKHIAYTVGLSDDVQDRHNARVMAAAPEMLEALREVAHHADDECGFMVQVRAAIMKAEGRS